MSKEIVFWGQVDDEHLTHTEMDDTIESILDGIGDIDDLPETLRVYGFARRLPNENSGSEAENVLDRLLEGLDEEYGNPDGDATEPTDDMRKAAVLFVETVLSNYTSWSCDLVKTEQINVKAWIKENRPDWIEDKDNEQNHS